MTKIELLHDILYLKQLAEMSKERIIKAIREKNQIAYKGKPIIITADFSTENLKSRRAWSETFQALKENSFNPRILYTAKLSFKLMED
jgi:hypothetical protein